VRPFVIETKRIVTVLLKSLRLDSAQRELKLSETKLVRRVINLLHRLYHSLPRPPSTNYNLRQLAYNPYDMLREGGLVLDVGCKSTRGLYAFSAAKTDLRMLGLDLEPFEGVDVVGDAHRLPFRSNSLDGVLCISVLEYVRNPGEVVSEIFRALKPGGLFYVNVPFVFRYAPDPKDLYRFSVPGIEVLCASFAKIQSGYNRGPASTMCDLLVHFNAILFCFNNRRVYNLLVDLFQWCLFWLKFADRWVGDYDMARIINSGVFFLGRKPLESGGHNGLFGSGHQ
jgi:SAM-dependent methyltransferase